MLTIQLYRYHPEHDDAPYMEIFEIGDEFRQRMVLEVLETLKISNPDLAYRRSCREGVCGSDGMNINGKNGLACITSVAEALGKGNTLMLRPLPGMPVIRDLVVDQALFFKQFEKVRPYLINDSTPSAIECLQSPEDRDRLDGLYECILCACCSSQCPSWWWNPEKFIGPAGLLQDYRFLNDSRDTTTRERLAEL
ncbi:succinate dehydrogenase iron-sulfur subunit [Modicisalibacter luteus]|nr:succinate dehydrogenase iron-sulfur subunit [Halomonas lutea]